MPSKRRKRQQQLKRQVNNLGFSEDKTPTTALCPQCSELDLSFEKFQDGTPDQPHGEIHLVSLNVLLGRSGCPLCRLITCTYLLHNELPPDKHIELSVWWDNHYGKRSINPDVTGARCLLVGGHSGSRIIPLAKDVSDLYLGRVVNEEANVELLKAWLPRCEAFHGSDCTQSIFTEVSQPWSLDCFLLIDVHEMCLVQPQEPCHYLALSYVWGMAQTFRTTTATFNELMQQHGLAKHKHHLPNTIKDAIKITEILQQRYLWIDQLCIVQDDGIFVEAAVQNMDKIYAHAYLTLIAASGDSANSGLAGAPGRPRGPQMIEEVKPSLWLTTQPNYRLSMAASTYETRGWTYQERVLSKRCLYFFPHCVMFTCKSALWREDTILEDPRLELTSCNIGYDLIEYGKVDPVNDLLDPASSDQELRSGKSLNNQRKKPSGPTEEYQLALSEFTKRDLRYEADTLRASAGVLNRIGASMGVHMLYGLPEELLDISLLWYPSQPTLRRNLFPSWTWAEWRGTPLLPLHFPRTGDLKWWQSTNTWIEWLKFDGTPFRELEKTEFYQEGEFHKCRPRDIPVETFPRVPLPTDSSPLNKLDHQALLRFWTIFVKLRVELDAIPYGGMKCFDLSDSEGNFAGRAIIHDTSWEAQLPSVAELVVLSQVLIFSESEPPGWEDDSFGYLGLGTAKYVYPKEDIIKRATAPVDYYQEEDYRRTDRFFNVLMISWNKLGVAERIGVGKIFRGAVKTSLAPGPVWKEVLLG